MKNLLKTTSLAFAMAALLAACSSNKTGGSADSSRVDSATSVKTSTDTYVKTDTINKDTLTTDTPAAKVDTVSKTVIQKNP